MNKRVIGIFLALLFLLVGYAVVTANLFVNSSVAIGFDEADFNIFFSKALDGETILNTISEDGDSFTYQSTGENMVTYSILNRSMKYDAVVNVSCNQESLVTQDDEVLLGGSIKTGTISSSFVGEITCELCSNAVERTENSEASFNVHTLTLDSNEGLIDITEFYFVEGEPIGKLPTPIKDGYNFVGWFNQPEGEPEGLEEITEDKVYSDIDDVTIYAHYEETRAVSFENDSWDVIHKALLSGDYPYQVGDTKEVLVRSHINDCYYTMDDVCRSLTYIDYKCKVRIANLSPCTDNEESQTACGVVIEFVEMPEKYPMNYPSSRNDTGGWASSSLRTYLNNVIYSSLPDDLQSIIIDTKVISSHGLSEENNFESIDKLYLFSKEELYSKECLLDSSCGTSRQLDYYRNKNVKSGTEPELIKYSSGTSSINYWLRSAYGGSDGVFFSITDTGYWAVADAPCLLEIPPAFRIY